MKVLAVILVAVGVLLLLMTVMLKGVLNWWKKSSRQRDHLNTFSGMDKRDESGLTTFQAQCLTAVAGHLPRASFERVINQDGTFCLVAPIDGVGTKLFIYEIEAGIYGPSHDWPFEELDFRTPRELITAVVQAVNELLPSNPTPHLDARQASGKDQPSSLRAGGRER
jgi:hypothetical protein